MSADVALDQVGLEPSEIQRYGRHLILPQVGMAGQRRLKTSKVLLIGVGGLGSPAATYLAAAGVGTLGLVDFDRVELSNLQRQILYGDDNVGEPKVDVARRRLEAINPHVDVHCHDLRLTADNALDLIADYDVVLDGSDNFVTRYLVNDACVMTATPLVWGAVARFQGQVAVFHPPEGGCYRCLFPEPPPPELVPSCAEGGVLGVLPGIIGSLQASEALKILLQLGTPTAGRLVIFEALELHFREIRVATDPSCVMCAASPETRRLVAFERTSCDVSDASGQFGPSGHRILPPREAEGAENQGDKRTMAEEIPLEIHVNQLKSWLDEGKAVKIVDVREPHEVEICRIDGSTVIPLRQVPTDIDDLDRQALTVVHCHHGARSMQAVMFMRQNGFTQVTNLEGGIDAWSLLVDPTVPRY